MWLYLVGSTTACLYIYCRPRRTEGDRLGFSWQFWPVLILESSVPRLLRSGSFVWLTSMWGCTHRWDASGIWFFTYLFVHLSAWALTIITIERVVCVHKPLRVREIYSLRRTITAWVLVSVTLVGIDLNFLWTADVYGHDRGFWIICSPIDLVLASAAPFAIILPCNFLIVVAITLRAAWRRNSSSTGGTISSTTVMLTVNSIACVLLTTPAAIELAWVDYGTQDTNKHTVTFLMILFHVLFNLNSSLNFLLYCASSHKFRKAMVSLCCKKPIVNNTIPSISLSILTIGTQAENMPSESEVDRDMGSDGGTFSNI